MRKTLIPFNYFGGKYMHANWIISKLPKTKSYVEVFGGSGIILINKPPCQIETYNDLNSSVVNFFKVLRERPEELIEQIYLTPYSREEFFDCYKNPTGGGDELERARRFYVVVNQSFNGTINRQSGWKFSTKASTTTNGDAICRWLSKVPNLHIIVERLRSVQISNFDFRTVFAKHDCPDALFYCDPPYMHSTRCNSNEYGNEMSESDHEDLLNLALSAEGKVAISGYDNDLYNDLLRGFFKINGPEKKTTLFHSTRQEILWTNYDPAEVVSETLFAREAV